MGLDDEAQKKFWEQEHGFRSYDHPVIKCFAEQRIRFISRYIDLTQLKSVLDVGCGSGFSTYYFAQLVPETWGVDSSSLMLSQNPIPKNKLVQADATCLPFVEGSFELIYCWELLHHIENPLPAVKEMARVSSKWVVIFEPNRYNPGQIALALMEKEHRWTLRYSRVYLRKLVEAAGLEVVKSSIVGCIFPNKTPTFMLKLLRHLPFEIPLLGISNVLICKKTNTTS